MRSSLYSSLQFARGWQNDKEWMEAVATLSCKAAASGALHTDSHCAHSWKERAGDEHG